MTDERLRRIREREYPDPPQGVFLNAASWGLVPRSAAEEVADLTLRRNRTHGFEEAELGAIQRRCRTAVARLLGARTDEIALAPNTSFGVSLAAALLRSGPPGEIVVSEGEFPANVLPFKALEPYGFRVRLVPCCADGWPDEARLVDDVSRPDVVALAVSAVQFASGYMGEMGRLGRACRESGVFFFVDAIQALGAVPFDPGAIGADLVASGGQKWLCSPWGSGFVWIRREIQARFDPPMVSWLAMSSGTDFDDMLHYRMDWRSSARKFELATLGIQDYLGLARAIEVIMEVGLEEVRDHIHGLHAPVIEWVTSREDVRLVTPLDAVRRAGIIAFRPREVATVAQALREARVVFSVREGAIRFAPHFYNTPDEMHDVVRIMDAAS